MAQTDYLNLAFAGGAIYLIYKVVTKAEDLGNALGDATNNLFGGGYSKEEVQGYIDVTVAQADAIRKADLANQARGFNLQIDAIRNELFKTQEKQNEIIVKTADASNTGKANILSKNPMSAVTTSQSVFTGKTFAVPSSKPTSQLLQKQAVKNVNDLRAELQKKFKVK